MQHTLETVRSSDGTTIAFDRTGTGPAVVLVGGAFNDRSTVAALAGAVAGGLSAVCYDRRSRGASGTSTDYSLEREVEDLAAVVAALGEPAGLFGHSSGAALVLEAAARGVPARGVAAYEPTYVVDGTRPAPGADLGERVRALVGEGRREDAAALFMLEAVGLPPEMVDHMRAGGALGFLSGLAHALPFDLAVCGPAMQLPADRFARITVPTLVLHGAHTAQWLAASARAVAEAVPGAVHQVLEGEDHGILQQPGALAEVLLGFYAVSSASGPLAS